MYNWILKDNGITTGLFLPSKKKIILGYQTGEIKIFNFDETSDEISEIYQFLIEKHDDIRTITRYLKSSIILIGTLNSGNIILFNIDNNKEILKETGYFSKYNRIFCSNWVNNNNFLIGSTYGKLNSYFIDKKFIKKNIDGHESNGIFGLACLNNNLIVSGDYFGEINIWLCSNQEFKKLNSLKGIHETIQAISIQKSGEIFATLGKDGTIQLFKKYIEEDNGEEDWFLYLRFLSGSGMGKFLTFSNDGKKLFAITTNEIIILDLTTTGIYRYPIKFCEYLHECDDTFLVINKGGIFKTKIYEPITKLYQTYNFAKVGVIGHTLVGKSTLCNAIVNDAFNPSLKSTEMKNVWDWNIDEKQPLKIVFHDFGGQRNIIPAHLPHLIDSDLILIVFSQRSVYTFEMALDLREKLIQDYGYKKEILFVRTYCDDKDSVSVSLDQYNKSNPSKKIEPLETKLIDNKIIGIDNLKNTIYSLIEKINPKVQIITNETKLLYNLIEQFQENEKEIVRLDEIYNQIKSSTPDIKKKYLLYTLKGLVLQGRVELRRKENEYYIYLNMRKILQAKNEILQFAYSNKGLIDWERYISEKDESSIEYYKIAMEMLVSNQTCIEHQNQRVFIEFLKEALDEKDANFIVAQNMNYTHDVLQISRNVDKDKFVKPQKWIPLFLDLNLIIGKISKYGGIFYYLKNNAYCYIIFEKPADILNNQCKILALINGNSEEIKINLKNDIEVIFNELFRDDTNKNVDLIEVDSDKEVKNSDKIRINSNNNETKSIDVNSYNGEIESNDAESTKEVIKKKSVKIKLFLAYAHNDFQTIVLPLVKKLENLGFKDIDTIPLKIGDNLIEKVLVGISKCDFGLLLISNKFLQNNWKKTELELITSLPQTQEKLYIIQFNISNEELKSYHEKFLNFKKLKVEKIEDFENFTENQIEEYMIDAYQDIRASQEEFLPELKEVDKETLDLLVESINIILFTAVEVERDTVLKYMKPLNDKIFILKGFIGPETYFIGKFGAFNAVLTMCGKGSTSSDGIALSSQEAFKFWKPKYAIMCGIAFGVDPEIQKIGDILVSKKVICYEMERVGPKDIPRGPIPESDLLLFNRFRNVTGWKFNLTEKLIAKIHYGALLSGEKLIDNIEYRNKLLEKYPEAIGGDMEAVGFYNSAKRNCIKWIVIKGICDWASGKTDKFQSLAAQSAVSLVHHILSNPNTFEER